LKLDLYTHKNAQAVKSVAAIRGFDYHGFRTKLTTQGFEIFDLPTSISAISEKTQQPLNFLSLSYGILY
jgi:hypothetical protein